MANPLTEASVADLDDAVLKEIKLALQQIQYGSLEIFIHNGKIVQLERREKKRFDKGDHAR
ncbi:YezD family protein [Cellvibrio sp. ARAG 10.3]|uniref:YezD family protein n=1 Tax=Cellvibrio sp. ARAG 10.3 TaxID=3451358 RepID=UPI003F469458